MPSHRSRRRRRRKRKITRGILSSVPASASDEARETYIKVVRDVLMGRDFKQWQEAVFKELEQAAPFFSIENKYYVNFILHTIEKGFAIVDLRTVYNANLGKKIKNETEQLLSQSQSMIEDAEKIAAAESGHIQQCYLHFIIKLRMIQQQVIDVVEYNRDSLPNDFVLSINPRVHIKHLLMSVKTYLYSYRENYNFTPKDFVEMLSEHNQLLKFCYCKFKILLEAAIEWQDDDSLQLMIDVFSHLLGMILAIRNFTVEYIVEPDEQKKYLEQIDQKFHEQTASAHELIRLLKGKQKLSSKVISLLSQFEVMQQNNRFPQENIQLIMRFGTTRGIQLHSKTHANFGQAIEMLRVKFIRTLEAIQQDPAKIDLQQAKYKDFIFLLNCLKAPELLACQLNIIPALDKLNAFLQQKMKAVREQHIKSNMQIHDSEFEVLQNLHGELAKQMEASLIAKPRSLSKVQASIKHFSALQAKLLQLSKTLHEMGCIMANEALFQNVQGLAKDTTARLDYLNTVEAQMLKAFNENERKQRLDSECLSLRNTYKSIAASAARMGVQWSQQRYVSPSQIPNNTSLFSFSTTRNSSFEQHLSRLLNQANDCIAAQQYGGACRLILNAEDEYLRQARRPSAEIGFRVYIELLNCLLRLKYHYIHMTEANTLVPGEHIEEPGSCVDIYDRTISVLDRLVLQVRQNQSIAAIQLGVAKAEWGVLNIIEILPHVPSVKQVEEGLKYLAVIRDEVIAVKQKYFAIRENLDRATNEQINVAIDHLRVTVNRLNLNLGRAIARERTREKEIVAEHQRVMAIMTANGTHVGGPVSDKTLRARFANAVLPTIEILQANCREIHDELLTSIRLSQRCRM